MDRNDSFSFSLNPKKVALLRELSKETGIAQSVFMRDALDMLLTREGKLDPGAQFEDDV